MALYRQGTASMDTQGVITGVDTKWREPLSLIRVGATIVFLQTPIKLAVINTIDSDTKMTAIGTDGDAVANGNYVILLHDSLTVDGMAQDVAETLRYYQSKETVIEEALEFFKDFDLDGLTALIERAEAAAQTAQAAQTGAQQAQTASETARDQANQIKTDTQTIKDNAVLELQGIKGNAVSEVGAIRDATQTLADQAQQSAQNAAGSNSSALTAKQEAEAARDKAKEYADSVNPEELLQKSENLADVPDKEAARTALDVPAKAEALLVGNNLSELANNAAAWLNVRPLGATPLSGDAVSDYDAVTLRQVRNLIDGGGGVGPSMNGVQNYGVGEKTLWDSRAFIPAWAVPLDGQLLNRAEWPELWAHAQMHSPIVDSDWLAAPSNRGRWSRGDGSTTFRCPDLNGAQDGSIRGLFGRGDGAGFYVPGYVFEHGAPNITGSTATSIITGYNAAAPERGTGVFVPKKVNESQLRWAPTDGSSPKVTYFSEISLDASKSNAAYGRGAEVRPNSFAGVWIVRASGGFVAANTSWSVTNKDEKVPDTGVYANGGIVRSDYKAGGNRVASFIMKSVYHDGDSDGVLATSGSSYKEWTYKNNGVLVLPATTDSNGINVTVANSDKAMKLDGYVKGRSFFAYPASAIGVEAKESNEIRMQNAQNGQPNGSFINFVQGRWYDGYWNIGGVRGGSKDLLRVQINLASGTGLNANYMFNNNGQAQATQWVSTSDRRVKSLWERIPDPLNLMKSMRGYSWYYEPHGTQGFGFMADEVEKFFPGAVSETEHGVELPDGSVVENVKSVDTYGVAAALHHEAILALMDEVKSLREEIKKLKGE